jgi:hypothetical protein
MKIKLEHEFKMIFLKLAERRGGVHGHPQAYDLYTSCPLIFPHNIMLLVVKKSCYLSQKRNIFFFMILQFLQNG